MSKKIKPAVNRMKPAKGVNYPVGSYGARGIYSIPVTFKSIGFTEEEANEWRQYGVGAEDAIALKALGLSVAAIQMASPWMVENIEKLGDGSLVARMYLVEFANKLAMESNGAFDVDDWPIDGIDGYAQDARIETRHVEKEVTISVSKSE